MFVAQALKRDSLGEIFMRESELKFTFLLQFDWKVPERLLPWSLVALQTGRAALNWSNSYLKKGTRHFFLSIWCLVFFVFCICWTVFVSCLQPHQLRVEIHRSPVWMPHCETPIGSAKRPVGSTHNQVASTAHVSNAQFRKLLDYQIF